MTWKQVTACGHYKWENLQAGVPARWCSNQTKLQFSRNLVLGKWLRHFSILEKLKMKHGENQNFNVKLSEWSRYRNSTWEFSRLPERSGGELHLEGGEWAMNDQWQWWEECSQGEEGGSRSQAPRQVSRQLRVPGRAWGQVSCGWENKSTFSRY